MEDDRVLASEALKAWAKVCDQRMSALIPADGSCSAEGCDVQSEHSTLMGLRLCGEHFSAFYSDAPVPMKGGVISAIGVNYTVTVPENYEEP